MIGMVLVLNRCAPDATFGHVSSDVVGENILDLGNNRFVFVTNLFRIFNIKLIDKRNLLQKSIYRFFFFISVSLLLTITNTEKKELSSFVKSFKSNARK